MMKLDSRLMSASSMLLVGLMLSVGLVGCGKHGEKKEATQVAAKVNGQEISIHQINQVLSRAQGVTKENAGKARNEVLERLITQQLAIEQATTSKLDQSPEVVMAIESAKREILAKAWMQQLAATAPKPADADVKNYFNEHPGLFAQRKLYNLQDIAFAHDEATEKTVNELLAKGKSMQEIAESLKASNVKFSANSDARSAEQLPIDLLPKLLDLKDGQTQLIDFGQAAHVVHLIASKSDPVTLELATPRIQQFFTNKRAQEIVEKEMKRLRQTAKVEYLGDFGPGKAATSAEPEKKPESAPSEAPSEVKKPSAPVDNGVAKGAAGL